LSDRDWSKAEMARIREETDKRIAERKQYLDSEIDRPPLASSIASRASRPRSASSSAR
jgi:hypothetical protein